MLEVKWEYRTCEFLHVLYDEVISRCRPSCDLRIASIDHVVGFCLKEMKEEMVSEVEWKENPLKQPGEMAPTKEPTT